METIISRYIVVPVVLLLLTFSSEVFAGQGAKTKSAPAPTTIVSKTITSGSAVDVGWQDDLSQTSLVVVDDSTNGTATAFLAYVGYSFDPASQVCTYDPILGTYCSYQRITYDSLSANINPNDLMVTGRTARLDTDLLMASNVVFSRCVYDGLAGGTYTCTDIPPSGQISLEWRKTSTDYVKSFGSEEIKTGPQIIRKVGTRQQFSAKTSGSLLGTPVQNRPGTLGTNRGVTIEILTTQ